MDILASLLDCTAYESKTFTGIVFDTRLNQARVRTHLQRLVAHGLVRITKGPKNQKLYSATDDGIRWLKNFKVLAQQVGLAHAVDKTERPDFLKGFRR
jgi:predicted transcriptional regulator